MAYGRQLSSTRLVEPAVPCDAPVRRDGSSFARSNLFQRRATSDGQLRAGCPVRGLLHRRRYRTQQIGVELYVVADHSVAIKPSPCDRSALRPVEVGSIEQCLGKAFWVLAQVAGDTVVDDFWCRTSRRSDH